MSKPWYTFRTAFSSDAARTGAAIQARGPAPGKGREGPLLEEVSETYDTVGKDACYRAALTALRLAHERGWRYVRIRIKEKTQRQRLKRLLTEEVEPAGEIQAEFCRLASTFHDVAIRAMPRGKHQQCRKLARKAIGLPRDRTNSGSYWRWLQDLSDEGLVELH